MIMYQSLKNYHSVISSIHHQNTKLLAREIYKAFNNFPRGAFDGLVTENNESYVISSQDEL